MQNEQNMNRNDETLKPDTTPNETQIKSENSKENNTTVNQINEAAKVPAARERAQEQDGLRRGNSETFGL